MWSPAALPGAAFVSVPEASCMSLAKCSVSSAFFPGVGHSMCSWVKYLWGFPSSNAQAQKTTVPLLWATFPSLCPQAAPKPRATSSAWGRAYRCLVLPCDCSYLRPIGRGGPCCLHRLLGSCLQPGAPELCQQPPEPGFAAILLHPPQRHWQRPLTL